MKKLIVNKEGKIIFDSNELQKKDITGDFLNKLFIDSLKKEIEFEIDETDPISKLFIMIRDETKSDSDFYHQYESLKVSYKNTSEEKTKIESAVNEDELPF